MTVDFVSTPPLKPNVTLPVELMTDEQLHDAMDRIITERMIRTAVAAIQEKIGPRAGQQVENALRREE